jgi:hypothetical protein
MLAAAGADVREVERHHATPAATANASRMNTPIRHDARLFAVDR